MPPPPDQLFLSFQTAVAGGYSLERELGRGGMGIVYLAREVSLDRLVAVKLLPPSLAAVPELRERFLREARTAARLSHPHIVPIHAVKADHGFVFYVMTYVQGESLGEQVQRTGPQTPWHTTRILQEVAWALAYAHAQGVVHRDVKPENILIESGSGRAMVTDFGIARLTSGSGGTGVGEVLGTPEFMSPEQAAGEPVDGRSDLYALGAVGFYALTGKPPFQGSSAQMVMAQHLTQPCPSLALLAPEATAPLAQGIQRCLAKRKEDRFANGEELAEVLGDALQLRREVPVPIRLFLRKVGKSQTAVASVGLLVSLLVLPALLMSVADYAGNRGIAYTVAMYVVLICVIALGIFAGPVWQLMDTGYSLDDVGRAATAALQDRREELAFERRNQSRRVLGSAFHIASGLALVGIFMRVALRYFGLPAQQQLALRELSVAMFILAIGAGLLAFRRFWMERDVGSVLVEKFWNSRYSRWLFRLVTIGVKPRMLATSHRPTELALGQAAEALFHRLDGRLRSALPQLPRVVSGLEQRAQAIRRRLDQLDRLIAESSEGAGARTAHTERGQLISDLTVARNAGALRLSEVVAALEMIRLDLLRLEAGAGKAEHITTDLQKAAELGVRVDEFLQAHGDLAGRLS